MVATGISDRQHFGGKVDSDCKAVVMSVLRHGLQ